MNTRLYIAVVKVDDGTQTAREVRLIRARSKAAALSYAVATSVKVEIPTADQIIAATKAGIEVEEISE